MAVVRLRAPLVELADGRRSLELDGSSVREVLRSLELDSPRLAGWILDERGRIRCHVNVFVNGEHAREDTPVGAADRVHVIPAISGGER